MENNGRLIVLDIDETIAVGDHFGSSVVKRRGLDTFLESHKDHRFVTFTAQGRHGRGPIRSVRNRCYSILSNIGISRYIASCYFGWNMKNGLKNMKTVAKDHGFDVNDIVLIGDSNVDKRSASIYGTGFIHVPRITDEVSRHMGAINPLTFADDYDSIPDAYSFENIEL